jgi:hypothetical protein
MLFVVRSFPFIQLFATHLWMADVLVVVKESGELVEITTRNNKTVCLPSNGCSACIVTYTRFTDTKARPARDGQLWIFSQTYLMGKASRAIRYLII